MRHVLLFLLLARPWLLHGHHIALVLITRYLEHILLDIVIYVLLREQLLLVGCLFITHNCSFRFLLFIRQFLLIWISSNLWVNCLRQK